MRRMSILYVILVFIVYNSRQIEEIDSETLIFTNVIVRHGARTPDVIAQFPSDPYYNYTFYPFGRAHLILDGKKDAYKVGESLRKRYGRFLGDMYYPDLIKATSSVYPRTKMTLQLILSALFPPREEYKLNEDLNWQPIQFRYLRASEDNLIATFRGCPKIFDIIDEVEQNDPKYRPYFEKYSELFQFLSEKSGWNVSSSKSVNFIYDTLKVETELGLLMPDWIKEVYPEPILTAARHFWKVVTESLRLKRLSSGGLLKKIIEDNKRKSIGQYIPSDCKMVIYSGHDFTVAPLLGAIGNFDGYHVPYTGYIIFELHCINEIYGFKIFYQDYKREDPRLLQVPGCDTFCPLDQFTDLVKENFPTDPWCT